MKVQTSEYVTLGHPDKVADYISSYILDRFLEVDKYVRYAVEVQVKDNHVTLGGELTSKVMVPSKKFEDWTREAVREVGYTHEYAEAWGADNAMDADKLTVECHISAQSADIAQGVNRDGWGDQGIFWGMATADENTDHMPVDYFMAKEIGVRLYEYAKVEGFGKIGLDIKTQVEMLDDKVVEVVVAAPMRDEAYEDTVAEFASHVVAEYCPQSCYSLTVNGTGKYVRHSSMGDCGTTGRKLAVDFYGGNCRIGGGSPWTKDGTKADVALNLWARKTAVEFIRKHPELGKCYVSISCCIGQSRIRVTEYNSKMEALFSRVENEPAGNVIRALDLREPRFAAKCRHGLFIG